MKTQRLRLRHWIDEDLPPFARMNADPEVMAFYPNPLTTAQSNAMAMRLQDLIAGRGWGLWAVELRETGHFIGYVGLHVPNSNLPCSPCVEVGWRLARPFWGHGYTTEGAHEALRIAFAELKLDEVVAFTSVNNRRSRAVMEAIGMVDAGENFSHPEIGEGSPQREHVLYRVGGEAWRAGVAAR